MPPPTRASPPAPMSVSPTARHVLPVSTSVVAGVASGWLGSGSAGARGRTTVAEHRQLADAIAAGDQTLAVQISRRHVEAARTAYATLAASELEFELEQVPQ